MQDDHGCWKFGTKINSGVLSIRPDPLYYDEMMQQFETREFAGGDQEVIEAYFMQKRPDKIATLPEPTAAFVWRCICARRGDIPSYDTDNVPIIHFTGFFINYERLARHGMWANYDRQWEDECEIPHYRRWKDTYTMAVRRLKDKLDNDIVGLLPEELTSYIKSNVFV